MYGLIISRLILLLITVSVMHIFVLHYKTTADVTNLEYVWEGGLLSLCLGYHILEVIVFSFCLTHHPFYDRSFVSLESRPTFRGGGLNNLQVVDTSVCPHASSALFTEHVFLVFPSEVHAGFKEFTPNPPWFYCSLEKRLRTRPAELR